jgi:hypothetical protein
MAEQRPLSAYDQIEAAISQLPREATIEEKAEMLNEWILGDLLVAHNPVEDGVVITHN